LLFRALSLLFCVELDAITFHFKGGERLPHFVFKLAKSFLRGPDNLAVLKLIGFKLFMRRRHGSFFSHVPSLLRFKCGDTALNITTFASQPMVVPTQDFNFENATFVLQFSVLLGLAGLTL